jgi:FtsH-binding integral membrane protein
MSMNQYVPWKNISTEADRIAYDEALRNFMLQVYNNMTIALAISGVVALGLNFNQALMTAIWGTSFKWVAIFSPLLASLAFTFFFDKMNFRTAQMALFSFAALMGLSLSSIFLVFKMGSIAQVFFISAATFGTASLYGYTTKKDLTSFGSFLIMGALGLVIAGVVNLFLQSSIFAFAISCLGVLIFTGLTAYDTQTLKNTWLDTEGEDREKAGIFGALQLYLDFINIFVSLLQLLGDRKND